MMLEMTLLGVLLDLPLLTLSQGLSGGSGYAAKP